MFNDMFVVGPQRQQPIADALFDGGFSSAEETRLYNGLPASRNLCFTQYTFGAGTLLARRTDLATQQVSLLATIESWNIDLDQELIMLVGQYKFPVDIAPGEAKITGKIKQARVQSYLMNNTLLGQTVSAASGFDVAIPENHSTIGATTFTVTNGATFLQDYGIVYHGTGIALTPVTASPSVGQYIAGAASVGTYTINAGDESVTGGLDVYYSYSVTTMFQTSIGQTLMGSGPQFELIFKVPYTVQNTAKTFNGILYAARASKIPYAFKNKGYLIPEIDFSAFANSAGDVGKFSITE